MRIFVSLLSLSIAKEVKYEVNKPVEDVRGGSTLKVTYPPNLIEALGNSGNLKTSLGNFGHI